MLTVTEAISQLTSAAVLPTERESLLVTDSLGRILAEDIISTISVPPADNSAMDGYAFCYADAVSHHFKLSLSSRIPAGVAPAPLVKNTVARIFTGAEIPVNADTVAVQENCVDHGGWVTIDSGVVAGGNVRSQGQDILEGCCILTAGSKVRAQEMGLLAAIGVKTVSVYRRLKIAIFSTGDELVDPGLPLAPGQIYNSNRATLIGLIQTLGLTPIDLGTVGDSPEATATILKDAAVAGDIIISAGGMSVGDEDYVKDAVASAGAVAFWTVAIKPGRPIAFGHVAGTPFIGLPGNPASVFATFMVLARPFLLASQGSLDTEPKIVKARAQFDKAGEHREVYLRARLTDAGVEIFPNQSSGVLSSACWGEVFVRQQSGKSIEIGDMIDVLPYAL
jgi:molybdopterin molybdotransferase